MRLFFDEDFQLDMLAIANVNLPLQDSSDGIKVFFETQYIHLSLRYACNPISMSIFERLNQRILEIDTLPTYH